MRATGSIVRGVQKATAQQASCPPRQTIYAEPMDDGPKLPPDTNQLAIQILLDHPQRDNMTEILAMSLIFLSTGIFAAHAYDAYRTR
jgi:hypothetical protein